MKELEASTSFKMVLVLGLVVLLFSGLTQAPLIDWDENIYGEASRQMLVRGDYLNPHINNQPFAEKPPFYFWVMAGLFKVFGVGEFAARSTSALSHLLFLLYISLRLRKLLGGSAFWYGLLYAAALGPMLSARFAVIDNMFNALIGVAAFELLFLWRSRQLAEQCYHATLAGLAMGVAVLTKGPLGGVIPLVAYAGLVGTRAWPVRQLWQDCWKMVPPLPFALAAVISLSIASSWFVINYFVSGPEFLAGFATFQKMLFSQPLDSHEGPFFYHFLVALVGLFPWTPLLLLYANKNIRQNVYREHKELIWFSLFWIGFVLVLFSFVRTKLPHYSASMYIPQTLLILLALKEALQQLADQKASGSNGTVPSQVWFPSRWTVGLSLGYVIVFGSAFAILPYTFADFREKMGFVSDATLNLEPHPLAFLPGVLLLFGGGLAVFFLRRVSIVAYISTAALSMGLFLSTLWAIVLPLYTTHNQAPLRRLMQEAYEQGGDLAMYRFLSFDLFFYGQRPIEVLHSYKFKGDATRLNVPGRKDLYVLARKDHRLQLSLEHPRLVHLKDLGLHSLFVLRAQHE